MAQTDGESNVSKHNIVMYNSTEKPINDSELVYASGYYAIGSDQSNTTTIKLQVQHEYDILMYDSTISVMSVDSSMLFYGSKTNAYMLHTILAYNSTNTGTNNYLYNNKARCICN